MKIWCSGNAGFLGGYLQDELEKLGHQVNGNDNLLCSSHQPSHGIVADCRDYDAMLAHLSAFRPDVLVHAAATAHEGLSNFSPSFVTKNIYEASIATFSAAIASGVKRIVYMSSMARYGTQTLPFHEDMRPRPQDCYGIAKVAAEDTLRVLCELHGVEYVILVPHNIVGPKQKYDDPARNVCSIMINRALRGEDIIIYGDGQQKRCFSPIKDCLHSLVKSIDAPVSGEVINIGPDRSEMTIYDLARIILDLTGNKVGIKHMPDRPLEVKEAYCTSSKVRRLLGYEPQQDLRECIKEMVLYIKENGTKKFDYFFPLEIVNDLTPKTWKDKLI